MADPTIASQLKGIGTDPGLGALRPPGVTSKPPRPNALPPRIAGPPGMGIPIGPLPNYPRVGLPSYHRQVR